MSTKAADLGQLQDAPMAAEVLQDGFHDLLEWLPGAVFQVAGDAASNIRYTYVSPRAGDVLGLSPESVLGDPLAPSRLVVPADSALLFKAYANSRRDMTSFEVDVTIRRPDQALRRVRTVATPRAHGDKVVWTGYWTDITDETQARERLSIAEQRLRAIFDHTRIGLVMIDRNLQFSDANPSLRQLLQVQDEQEFARDFPSFSPPTQPDGQPSMDKARDMILKAFDEGYNRFDWMHQTRAGEPRPCEIALTRVELGGEPVIFATMTDLRERKRVEAALEAASLEARAASQAKTDFLANMSHEIRTPMNAIVGLTHLGLTSADPERLRGYLSKIDTAAKSLLQIINDILDFSKIEAGMLTLESTRFDLYSVLDSLSGMLDLPAAEKSLELLFEVEPDLCSQLVGDPLRLGQILLNLAGNAIKFTERGQVLVRVSTVKKGGDFVRLRFEVVDTGIGLSPEQIERLFTAFSQADNSTTRRYGGTGLGLAICRRLVDLMDGEIGVDSQPGVGSSFHFTARFGIAPAALARPQTPATLRGLRVLVVDDNSTALAIMRAYLRSFGFEVATAASGAQAIELFQSASARPFRLVLMDWQMPGMNGIEAARRLRGLMRPDPVMVIMITAFGREEVQRQATAAGLDGFLIKPVNPSVLLDTIVNAFGKDAALPRAATALPADLSTRLAGKRVLLVEDNEINQEVAKELMQRVGLVVDLAVNGAEAVDCAARTPYDAVLMDMQMPVMDGFEATRRIRALPGSAARVPIIAMTANAMAEDRQRCLDARMDDHLGKPVDAQHLHTVLARWILGDLPESPAPAMPLAMPPLDFDFDGAIRLMADSRSLWSRMARRYLDTPRAADEIAASLAAGDHAVARRMAHTLKGVAGALGLLALQRGAAMLEHRLADAATDSGDDLRDLARLDETARHQIGQHLTDRPGAPA